MKTIVLSRIKYENLKRDKIAKVKVNLKTVYPSGWDPNSTEALAKATQFWRLGKS
jgi:hypothetical protein